MLDAPATIDPRLKVCLMMLREGLRMILRAIEEYADLPRSFETKAERRNGREA